MFNVGAPTKGKKLTKSQTVISELSDLWKQAFESVNITPADPTRNNDLHPSSLPYCGLRHAYEWNKEGIPETRELSIGGLFFTEVGKIVHEILQDHIGRWKKENKVKHKVQVLGNWKCDKDKGLRKGMEHKCGGYREFSEYKKCPKCKGRMHYEEIGIKWRNFVGHIDKVVRIGKMIIILDYKTTSSMALGKHRNGGGKYLPYKKNVAQVACYAALLPKQYRRHFERGGILEGCYMAGWVLAYVGRENPSFQREFLFGEMSKADLRKSFLRASKDSRHFAMAKAARKAKDFELLIEEKPCSSLKNYEATMEDPFDKCPLASFCFNRKKLDAKILKAVTNSKR